jgi:hypothetical protein
MIKFYIQPNYLGIVNHTVVLTRRMQEWVVAIVKDRASTLDSLIAGKAPVDSRIDSGPLNNL